MIYFLVLFVVTDITLFGYNVKMFRKNFPNSAVWQYTFIPWSGCYMMYKNHQVKEGYKNER